MESSKLVMKDSMKNFNRMSINKSKRFVDYLKYLETEIDSLTQHIALLMEQVNTLRENELPTIEDLREWNILR